MLLRQLWLLQSRQITLKHKWYIGELPFYCLLAEQSVLCCQWLTNWKEDHAKDKVIWIKCHEMFPYNMFLYNLLPSPLLLTRMKWLKGETASRQWWKNSYQVKKKSLTRWRDWLVNCETKNLQAETTRQRETEAKNKRGRWEAWISEQETPRQKGQARFRRQAEECSATLAPQIPNPAKATRT